MIRVGIVGGTGYTSGELIRLVLSHPATKLDFVYSSSRPGSPICRVHEDLISHSDLTFSSEIRSDADVIFLCTGHGVSKAVLAKHSISEKTKIIDLSRDFRLEKDARYMSREYVYGLPELHREKIRRAENVANPGCFATAIQLALMPLAKSSLLNHDIHINATTGSTGAGASLTDTTHFSWRHDNVSWYKAFTHQHLSEIRESLSSIQGDVDLGRMFFIPQRGTYTRGIFGTIYTHCELDIETAYDLYQEHYRSAPFVTISTRPISLKSVINTNHCHLHLHKHDDVLLITTAIDNLIKGASGQAIQNMNLMMGLDESTGLNLKASYF